MGFVLLLVRYWGIKSLRDLWGFFSEKGIRSCLFKAWFGFVFLRGLKTTQLKKAGL